MISTIAFAPPRSACPCRLSASSSRMSFRLAPRRLAVVDPEPATRSRADFVRWSEAFSSTTSQFMSFARAYALEVLPIPGFPYRMSGFFCRDQSRAHSYICLTAPAFPTTSRRRCGLYFSAQSMGIYTTRCIKNTTPEGRATLEQRGDGAAGQPQGAFSRSKPGGPCCRLSASGAEFIIQVNQIHYL